MSRIEMPSFFLRAIVDLEWYHPNCDRHYAEALLMQNGSEGSYLMRPGSDPLSYVMCIRCKDSVKHFALTTDGFQVGFGLASFKNAQEFKEHFHHQPFIAGENGLITWLKHPYPRDVREPAMYDHIRIHAQLQETGGGQPQEHLALGTKEGFLTKIGGFVKSWKVRWFVLRRYELKYYKHQLDVDPIRVLDLRECTLCSADAIQDRPHCFSVVFPWRTFQFSCESGPDRDEWVESIQWKLKHLRTGTL